MNEIKLIVAADGKLYLDTQTIKNQIIGFKTDQDFKINMFAYELGSEDYTNKLLNKIHFKTKEINHGV